MFGPDEIQAIYLSEATRHPVSTLARWWSDYRPEFSNFQIVQRAVVVERGPRQLTFRWMQE